MISASTAMDRDRISIDAPSFSKPSYPASHTSNAYCLMHPVGSNQTVCTWCLSLFGSVRSAFIIRSHNQDGTGSFVQHIFGCAAHNNFLKRCYSLGSQNNQVGLPLPSAFDDLDRRQSVCHLGGERQTIQR